MIKTNITDLQPSRIKFKQQVRLLSGGYACPAAFPGGMITVFPWDSSINDWIVSNARKRGNVLWELLPKLCNLNGCPPNKFVMGDLNTVLLVARAITKDNEIHYTAACPHCQALQQPEVIRVPDELARIGEKSDDYPGFDTITLPKSGDVVNIRPLEIGDEKMIEGRTAEIRERISDNLARILAALVDVGGGKPDSLEEAMTWWLALEPTDQAYYQSQQDLLYPHLGTAMSHTCDRCSRHFDHELSLDNEFFR